MTAAAASFALAVALGALTSLSTVAASRRVRPVVGGLGTALAGAAGLASGIAVLSGQSFSVSWQGLLPLSGVAFTADPLAALFLVATGGVAIAAGIYGIGYARDDLASRPPQAVFPLFVVAMLLVPVASTVGTLLVCWELMALASLALVLAEHRRRDEVASAGRWYAVMTHLGFLAILAGFAVLAAHAPADSFDGLRQAHLSPHIRDLVFVLTLAGFSSKAGILPLHAWLPRAHPEAPSHVSALMSAAMVNLGVYGIVRTGFDLLGGGPRWWWLVTLTLGALSAIHGMLQAAMGTDLKRLLGYSTTENMGLVLVGVGAAGLFSSTGHRELAGLALAAALFHVLGHAAFKTLLFLAAGSVLHGTGTRDLDALGGLRRPMPWTTALFGAGALAASALPPGTAFVSEWLLLQALVHGLPAGGAPTAIAMPLAVASIALTAGLAVATFVKAFGVGFLARPRGEGAVRAHESPPTMLIGMGLAAAVAVVLALVPSLVLPAVGRAAGLGDPAAAGLVTVRLTAVAGSLSPLLLTAGLLGATVALVAALRAVGARRARQPARLWDCGAGPLTARMEYTATSFAEPLQRVFDDVVRPETDVDVSHYEESAYLVSAVAYRRKVPDRIERRFYRPVLDGVARWGQAGRWLANGSVHRYLGYGFYTVVAVLIVLAVTR
ncbi:hydrogenase 4 subunit B [Amycolatopsis rhizosphaerae]|uniref:Hydrogenase 4 subunit B n=1 Tax=Amycolatopsis rhizosphaerae TaxID=2053003 RepID=A0A558BDZ8_9PSEU|nr:proton-conducting transporter membrane subunit [Amycolatopsis rhizosphaerae]TVT34732.1 hydrogenase 4 subunit B [Amycolatopsis rhizosphaerae]